jgi:hypothetical protein
MSAYNIEDLKGKDINLIGPENNNKISNNRKEGLEGKVKDQRYSDIEGLNHLDLDTLDEPIVETLKRDFIKILHKIEYAVIPRTTANDNKQLRNCNFYFN